MAWFPHKYREFSGLLKILSCISFATIIANLWNIYTFYPLYTFLNKMTFWQFFLNLPLQYLALFILVVISGITDSIGVLYLFPILAYYLLSTKLCYLISNNKITHVFISSVPAQLEALFTCVLIFFGLAVLIYWHRKNAHPLKPSRLISVNLNILSSLAIIILIILCYLIYEHFSFYLDQTYGLIAMALNQAGLEDLIVLGLIFIFGIKK